MFSKAVKRQSTSTLIVERISKAFMCEEEIEFAYVKREVLLSRQGEQPLPPQYLRINPAHEQPITGWIV